MGLMSPGARSRSSQNEAELAIEEGPAMETAVQADSKQDKGRKDPVHRRVE